MTPHSLRSDYLDWCMHERERLLHQRTVLASGAFRIGYNFGSGWVDDTSGTLTNLDATIAELDRLIGDMRATRLTNVIDVPVPAQEQRTHPS
jgi:hypothetical protein